MSYITKEELALYEKQKSREVWYNPTKQATLDKQTGKMVLPETAYVGGSNGSPTWTDPALDVRKLVNNISLLKQGKLDDDYKVKSDPFIGEWKNIAHTYADLKTQAIKSGSMSSLKSAGIGMSTDFAAVDILNVQAQIVGTELRDFTLEQAVTTVATPSLQLEVDAWTRFLGQKRIGETVPAILKLGSLARTSFDLPKDGAAIALSFEAQTRAVHDLYRLHVDNAVSDLKRIKANSIATELETATDVSAGDWAAYTTDHSTRSPYDDIGAVTDTIVANNGMPNTIASHDKVYRDFIANTNVNGFVGPNHNGQFSTARVITDVPGLPGFTWYIDNEKTATIMTIYDKKAVYHMQGPIRTAVWRDEQRDVDAFRIFDFNLNKIIESGKIRDLTSVTA